VHSASRSTAWAIVALAAALSWSPAPCHANPQYDEALELLERLEYERAYPLLERSLQLGGNDPERVRALLRKLAEVAVILGDDARAQRHFEMLLLLDPDFTLGAGESPKIRERYRLARLRVRGLGSLEARHRWRGSELRVELVSDPLALVQEIGIAYRDPVGGERHARSKLSAEPRFTVTAAVEVDILLYDSFGNVLVRKAGGHPELEEEEPALLARWYLWAGCSLAFAGGATYFGLAARADQRDLDRLVTDSSGYEYRYAREVADSLERNALMTNVSLGASVAAATTAVIVYLWSRPATSERNVGVSVSPSARGAGLSLAVPF